MRLLPLLGLRRKLADRFVVMGVAAPSGPLAPILTWDDNTADTTPNFSVDLPSGNGAPRDAAANDVLRIQYSSDSGANWSAYLTHTLDAGDIAGDPITVTGVTPLANGSYVFRARLERGSIVSAWSASENATVNAAGYLYWRIEVDDAVDHSDIGLDWDEVEFLISGVDQAVGGTASASSAFSGLPAANAFDDNIGTRWASDFSNTWPQWLQYQFSSPKLIDQISITPDLAIRAPENCTIKVSSNGTDFTTYDVFNTGAVTDWTNNVKRTFTLTP